MSMRLSLAIGVLLIFLTGCGRSAIDEIDVGRRTHDRIYQQEPVGPSHDIVLLRREPRAWHDGSAVYISTGWMPYVILPTAWQDGAEWAAEEADAEGLDALLQRIEAGRAALDRRIQDLDAAYVKERTARSLRGRRTNSQTEEDLNHADD